MSKTVTIGGATGAWGDTALSTPQLLKDGRCDYICYEGLAELTMAVLTRARDKKPELGYATDLIQLIARNLTAYHEQGIKVVTNAGGVNIPAAVGLITAAAEAAGLDLRIASVTGDELTARVGELRALDLREIDKGTPVPDDAWSMNAYTGARAIAAALDAGADVVVTGRCVDSAIFLGPLIHEFGWGPEEFDKLASGTLAGHLLECGAAGSGGTFTDWRDTGRWINVGYPIAMVEESGDFVVTKPEGTDGIVDRRSVAEQMVYEIGDPSAYLVPDVVVDLTDVSLEDVAPDQVAVSGVRGTAPPSTLKACAQVADGFRGQMMFMLGGRDAIEKAERFGADSIERGRMMLKAAGFDDFRDTNVEVLGAEATYGANANARTREVIIKLAARHDDFKALAGFFRELVGAAIGGPQGMSFGGQGVTKPSPALRLDSFAVPRELVPLEIALHTASGEPVPVPYEDVPLELCADYTTRVPATTEASAPAGNGGATIDVPLAEIAHGRSGDKGAHVNIGVIARDEVFWPVLQRELSSERVGTYLAHLGATSIERFEMPGPRALNFLLRDGLGAGGTESLRFDSQGKAVAGQLLDLTVSIPAELADHPSRMTPERERGDKAPALA
jgi:hypothetical protein